MKWVISEELNELVKKQVSHGKDISRLDDLIDKDYRTIFLLESNDTLLVVAVAVRNF
jgi:hypothetical protein